MNELLEAVTAMEEVAGAGEAVESVDLTTVSQQLDQVIGWQAAQFGLQSVLLGAILGAVIALVIGRMWR